MDASAGNNLAGNLNKDLKVEGAKALLINTNFHFLAAIFKIIGLNNFL